ncbi:MAG: tetratricopeptide repeat protein [Planctomycetia bacterium]|nr:tetratricopeptide repeat protein [Planctomycetia bacterium]
MNPFPVLFGLYPGWEGLSKHGRWRHLAVAWAFACLLDLVLWLTCYWTDLIPYGHKRWLFLALAVAWLVLAGIASQLTKRLDAIRALDSSGDLYQEVLTHYLKGNWSAAESCAQSLLKYNPQDAEALLLLATLYRHLKRPEHAKAALNALKKLETSDKWFEEIIWEERELMRPEVPEEETRPEEDDASGQAESESHEDCQPRIFVG